jgi:phosphate-selective porin OprO/OprP
MIMPDASSAEPPQVRYAIPDFAPGRQILPQIDRHWLSSALSLEMIGDWTGFRQDDASLRQVGEQADKFEVRSARVRLSGRLGASERLGYVVAAQYRGFDVDPQRNWDITDLAVTYQFSRNGTRLQIGQIRETFSYEIIGATATMPQSERVLSPFAASRNLGVSATYVFGKDDDWNLSAGIYRDSFGFSGSGAGATARLTHLLWENAAAGRYLHVGGAWRRRPAVDGTLRYRGRPGSNVADNFVDTGDFQANRADHLGLEALWSDGGLSVLTEFVGAFVNAPEAGNPFFHGFYVTGSFVLTGESRPYNRALGLARRIVPRGRWGAPELVARFGAVELNGGSVRGGRYDRIDLGVNWWATTRWKMGVNAGRTWLKRNDETGVTDSFLVRLQYVY